jgi:hypothetical protein
MAGSRANWEDSVAALRTTDKENYNSKIEKPIPTTNPTAQQKVEQVGKSFGGLVGNSIKAILENKDKQRKLLEDY